MVGSYVSQVGRISQGILSPVRMPIPPLRHLVKVETRQILTHYKVFPIAVNQELETTVFLGGECA